MLLDVHCHIDAYPQPAQALTAGGAAGVRTIAVTTSLVSYVRTRLLCQQHPGVQVALGLHPRRAGGGYEQWPEWKQMLDGGPVVGEVGLDFSQGSQEEWAAQVRTLAEICRLCAEGNRLVMLHASHAESEAWETVSAQHLRWVVWHSYRPEAPRLPLYRAVEAGHLVAVGPDMAQSGSLQSRLRAIPREMPDAPPRRIGFRLAQDWDEPAPAEPQHPAPPEA